MLTEIGATEIGFYHVTALPVEQVLPKLLEKIYAGGKRAVIKFANEQQVRSYDQLLWNYNPDSFLPHGSNNSEFAHEQPIILTCEDVNPNGATVFIAVGEVWNDSWNMYERCLLMFDGHKETELDYARKKWKWCKEQQAQSVYWKQSDQGAWQKVELA